MSILNRKVVISLVLALVILGGFCLIKAQPADAITIASANGNASSCPDKSPYNTKTCTSFIQSITVNGYTDSATDSTSRRTPIPYGYIVPGKTITISWTRSGTAPTSYLVKYGCGNSIDLGNDDYTIQWTTGNSISWSVPNSVSNYMYCKVWVYAKQYSSSTSNNPTLGVSNTRPFLIEDDSEQPPTTSPTSPLSVSCYASPSSVEVGDSTTFVAEVSGGSPSYRYSWSGDVSGSSSRVTKYFSYAGYFRGAVTVTDSKGQSKSASCYVNVSSTPVPPTYTPPTYNPPVTYYPPYYPPETYTPPTYYPPVTYYPPTTPTTQPMRFSCSNVLGQCVEDAAGAYSYLSLCNANCQAPAIRYACATSATGAACIQSATGAYTSLTACQNSCTAPVTPKWSCNQLTWQCVSDTNGSYTDSSTCQAFCKQPNNPVPTVSISANPSVINRGQTSILTWTSQNATYCTASGSWSGSKNVYGQESVNPYTTSTYVITCYNSQGASASASTVVTVNDINPTVDITVYPSTIVRGQTAILSWNSQNANNCNGTSTNNVWTGYKNTSGSEQTSPSQTTTYTITCTGQNGSTVSDWVTLNVNDSTNNQYLTLSKLGRNLSGGDNSYKKVIRVAAGDVVEFYLQIDNLSGNQLNNVTITDTLPLELRYYVGSTKVDNISQVDGIANGGLNLGTIAAGGRKTVTLQAVAQQTTSLFAVTNIASVRADNNTAVTDSATVTYSAVAGAATVNTGPAETMLMIFGGTSSITAGAWYFLKKTRKGKTFWETTQENIIKKHINKLRVK